ncbi:hypothetical protein RQP46_003487 [Phenoliferia psychrophenolica]
MSRYANRPPRQLPPPPQHYNQPSGYYAEGQPHYTNNRVGYPTEDDDEDTMVATDVSAMPPARGGARMTWGQNDTRSFDKTAPPHRPPPPSVPEDSPEERNLIRLLKDMNFSMALKDFHDTFSIGVQKTIVAADGMGHAYTKIHCKKLPRADVVAKDPHLNRHWVPLTGNRWLFKTESHKIVYYGSGVGSDPGIASYGEGLTGAGLATKVEETYAFLAGNYVQGDEIALFGFSRGAYTARMVAGIIGEIGLLGKVEAEGAAKKDDTATLEKSRKILEPFRTRAQAQIKAAGGFLIKLVGVFDTVGAMGLPTELHKTHPKAASIFGFSNTLALHAMALNETRRDFIVTKWTQTEEGRAKGQTLKQVWFAGSHSDVGGGWQDAHDLADVALAWMVSNTAHVLAFDPNYIRSIPNPTAPYGEQPPHNPEVGIFTLAASEVRSPPTSSTFPTAETIHYSVTKQPKVTPAIAQSLAASPSLVRPLEGFEKLFAESWDLGQPQRPKPQTLTALTQQVDHPSSEMGGVHRAFAELEDLAERVSGIKIPGHAATSLAAFRATSRPANALVTDAAERLYRHLCFRTGYCNEASSAATGLTLQSLSPSPTFDPAELARVVAAQRAMGATYRGCHSWEDFARRRSLLDHNWRAGMSAHRWRDLSESPDQGVWRFKLDPEACGGDGAIVTSGIGGGYAAYNAENGNKTWDSIHPDFRYPHVELSAGYLVMSDPHSDDFIIWRRSDITSPPALIDPATAVSLERGCAADPDGGAAYSPFCELASPSGCNATKLRYPTFVAVSFAQQEFYLWDLPTATLTATISIAPLFRQTSPYYDRTVQYVELDDEAVFIGGSHSAALEAGTVVLQMRDPIKQLSVENGRAVFVTKTDYNQFGLWLLNLREFDDLEDFKGNPPTPICLVFPLPTYAAPSRVEMTSDCIFIGAHLPFSPHGALAAPFEALDETGTLALDEHKWCKLDGTVLAEVKVMEESERLKVELMREMPWERLVRKAEAGEGGALPVDSFLVFDFGS